MHIVGKVHAPSLGCLPAPFCVLGRQDHAGHPLVPHRYLACDVDERRLSCPGAYVMNTAAEVLFPGIALPQSVVVHGFIAGADGRKMLWDSAGDEEVSFANTVCFADFSEV